MLRSRRAQSVIDYAIFFAVILTVILIMSKYIRGSLSGKLRSVGDRFGGGEVYEYKGTSVSETTPSGE